MGHSVLAWIAAEGLAPLLPFLPPLLLLCIGVALLYLARRARMVTTPVTPEAAAPALPTDYVAAADELAATIRPALVPGVAPAIARDALALAAHRLVDASQSAGAVGVGRWAKALEHAARTADPEILGDLFEALEEERRATASGR